MLIIFFIYFLLTFIIFIEFPVPEISFTYILKKASPLYKERDKTFSSAVPLFLLFIMQTAAQRILVNPIRRFLTVINRSGLINNSFRQITINMATSEIMYMKELAFSLTAPG